MRFSLRDMGGGESKDESATARAQRFIDTLLSNTDLSNHERQAALAASKLGEGVLDGSEAIKSGLAKRGVAQNYVMIEGCPKDLGCTVVLRGANRAALKQVKMVFRFMINMAYNLRLETSYLRERGARIRPDFEVGKKYCQSTSLCVDFGPSPTGKKVRPWNGGNNETVNRTTSSEITAFDHQAILITSVWMTEKTQCCPAEVKGICYYSMQDVALGQFLRDSCFNLSLKCQNPNCKKTVLDHSLSFVHNDGLINITVCSISCSLRFEVRLSHLVVTADRLRSLMTIYHHLRLKTRRKMTRIMTNQSKMVTVVWIDPLQPGRIVKTVEKW